MIQTSLTNIHYQLTGDGPLLVIAQSGEGDADRSQDLVGHLNGQFTVLTYDRRGLSRSRYRPGHPASMSDHAEDLSSLLAHITDEPALMLGCSLGATIGLHVAAAHPGLLDAVVAHEPIAPWLLPSAVAQEQKAELLAIQSSYVTGGLEAALPMIVGALGIQPADASREPDLAAFPMDAQRRVNFDYFIRHDFTAAVLDDLSPVGVSASSTRIIPAAGIATPTTVYDFQCAQALARLTGERLRTFPGGHNGNLTHPRAYACALLDAFSERS